MKGHVQDGDLMTMNLINECNKNIVIFIDPNHIKGKFNRLLEKFNEKGDNCFNPLKKKLSEKLQFK